MKAKSNEEKRALSIRLPLELDKRIAAKAKLIGVAKSAVILTVLHKEFFEANKDSVNLQD